MTPEENVSLARHTSLHVGGPARYFVHAKTTEDVQAALTFAAEKRLPFFVLGKGSNTLFPDEGYPGVIIHMEERALQHQGTTMTASAGVFMRQLVNYALDHGLRGLEELAGIPGTVGGAIRGNAGTWNTTISQLLTDIEVLKPDHDGTWSIAHLPPEAAHFGYRDSIFKREPQWIILRGTFQLKMGDAAEGQALVTKDLTNRHERQPYDAPSAGSMFKNPDREHGIFSGKLIEEAGLKGTRQGGAEISAKHGNFIINRGGATSADVQALITLIQDTVRAKFGVSLEPEVHIVPAPEKLSASPNTL